MNLLYKYVILRDSTQNQYMFFLLHAAPLIHIDCSAVRCYVLLETIDVEERLTEHFKNVSFRQSRGEKQIFSCVIIDETH